MENRGGESRKTSGKFSLRQRKNRSPTRPVFLEASLGFEPGIRELQSHALPLGYDAISGADYGARTRYLHLGKVALYQMSYIRLFGASDRNRTNDTRIFSPLLYRLSYRGKFGDPHGARTHDL